MRVTILGATGFVGRHLATALRARGDEVVAVSLRDPAHAARICRGSAAVINLAGAAVSKRWTQAHKRDIERSRVDLPHAFIDALAAADTRPACYVSASAIGYYGRSTTATFTEASPPGSDFLARVCVEWEAGARRAAGLGMQVAVVRTGLVLGADGGALTKLLPIFRIGLGGVVAGGDHEHDREGERHAERDHDGHDVNGQDDFEEGGGRGEHHACATLTSGSRVRSGAGYRRRVTPSLSTLS